MLSDLFTFLTSHCFFGASGTFWQIFISVVALPAQAYQIWTRKDSGAVSFILFGTSWLASWNWLLHATCETWDPFLAISQIPGVICGGIICAEIVWYRGGWQQRAANLGWRLASPFVILASLILRSPPTSQ